MTAAPVWVLPRREWHCDCHGLFWNTALSRARVPLQRHPCPVTGCSLAPAATWLGPGLAAAAEGQTL